MKHLFWTTTGVLITASMAMADIAPDPSFREKSLETVKNFSISPIFTLLVTGIVMGSLVTWLVMRAKRNGTAA